MSLEMRVAELESVLKADAYTLLMRDNDSGRRGVRFIGAGLCVALT